MQPASLLLFLLFASAARGQDAPNEPPAIDAGKTYTLAELIDFAERHNPETRVTWERAKQQAALAGIVRAELLPTVAASAFYNQGRRGALVGTFARQDIGLFQPTISLYYTLFDAGARRARIDAAQAQQAAANLVFRDTHRQVIFNVSASYYRLLDARGRMEAAAATLHNAETVQASIEERLKQGLATLPDVLEARAATAQARYEVAATEGAEETSRGDLATALGVPVATAVRVENLASVPLDLGTPVETAIEKALENRPDLLAQDARIRAADAGIREARSALMPNVKLSFDYGMQWVDGRQNLGPLLTAHAQTYAVQATVAWTVFDGGARQKRIAMMRAERDAAQAERTVMRDQVENEVWSAYSHVKTSIREQEAATALLAASEQSYSAALEAYKYGVRNFLDVVTAQRDLARARTAMVTARTQLMTNLAALAFRTGDLVRTPGRP